MVVKLKKVRIDPNDRIEEIIKAVGSLSNLSALWLFGSYAKGDATPLSDIDIAYLLREGLTDIQAEELDRNLYRLLSQILETDEITLVNLREAPFPFLVFSVIREGKLLFCPERETLCSFQERLLGVYPDSWRLRKEVLMEFEEAKGTPMKVDKEKVLYHLRLLEGDLRKLREKAEIPREKYLVDSEAQTIVERKFQTATESSVNIGNHLISRMGLRMAEDYASLFPILAEAEVITPELAEKMADMARFRNLLVHVYWHIDHEKVYARMRERIETLEAFLKAIHDLMEKYHGRKPGNSQR